MTRRSINLVGSFGLVLWLTSMTGVAAAQSTSAPSGLKSPELHKGLQSPEQRTVRNTAYALPKGTWALEGGVFGVTGEELYSSLGAKYGFGGGFQLDLNLAHYAVGLFNFSARWCFLDTEHIAIGARVDFTYGYGAWIWVVGPLARDLLEEANIINVPMSVTATAPLLPWLEADLAVGYQWGTVFGTLGDGGTFFAEAQIGGQQFAIRPAVRVFVSDATSFELAVDLPLYTQVPYEGDLSGEFLNRGWEKSGSGSATVPLDETWKLETGVRSALTPWFFASLRLHYGKTNKYLYSTTINPSLSVEARW